MALAPLKNPRSSCAGFTVNDAIYVFGGESGQIQVEESKDAAHDSDTESSTSAVSDPVGEKFVLNGNRWKEFSAVLPPKASFDKKLLGPSALLYE